MGKYRKRSFSTVIIQPYVEVVSQRKLLVKNYQTAINLLYLLRYSAGEIPVTFLNTVLNPFVSV